MKKIYLCIMTFICFFVFAFITNDVSANEKSNEFKSSYETWGNDLSYEEQKEYYYQNDIFIATPEPGTDTGMTSSYGVKTHLSTRFPNYNWSVDSSNMHSVSDVYRYIPDNISSNSTYIENAKDLANNDYTHIGCGPLALISQFEYLSKSAGYKSLISDINNEEQKTEMAREVIADTRTYSSDEWYADIISSFVHIEDGTFTFPSDFIASARKILENHYLSVKKTRQIIDENGNTTTETYYDNDTQIYVSGDIVPSLSSFEVKKANLINSIDKGMPVVLWTTFDAGNTYSNHYMNVFGYEYWTGVDNSNNTKTHLILKLRCNWSSNTIYYMDSELLNAINCGFIFFEETNERTTIARDDYNSIDCQYYYTVTPSEPLVPSWGNSISVSYLRTGYVKRYDSTNTVEIDNHLVLSAKRENAGVAYIEYSFDKPVDWIYLEAGWWGYSEGIDSDTGAVYIQYKNSNNLWITQMDLLNSSINLSKVITEPSKIKCEFSYPVYEFRIYVESYLPTTSRNKGRLVIGNMMAIFGEEHIHSYTDSYEQYNSLKHISYCVCGASEKHAHVIRQSNTGSRYANCLCCGYLLDLSSDITIVASYSLRNNDIIYISENGSYIKNDIVYLVDEDIIDYLNGNIKLSLETSNVS